MGKKMFTIFVTDASNDYVVGIVSGIIRALSGEKIFGSYRSQGKEPTMWMRFNTTRDRYLQIKQEIEIDYPGLCAFES